MALILEPLCVWDGLNGWKTDCGKTPGLRQTLDTNSATQVGSEQAQFLSIRIKLL